MNPDKNQCPTPLSDQELLAIGGGSPLSKDFFRTIGVAFEVLNYAAQVGAPQGNIYRHGG